MADPLDAFEGLELLARVLLGDGSVDELDRLRQSAGGFGFPHFAETPGTQTFDQSIAGDRFRVLHIPHRHGNIVPPSSRYPHFNT